MEGAAKKHVVEEFEELDYSDLFEDLPVSTGTAGPNVTDYEVRLAVRDRFLCSRYRWSFPTCVSNPPDRRV